MSRAMPPRTNRLFAAAALVALALPVLAQDRPTSILPPGFGDPAPPPAAKSAKPPKATAPAPSRSAQPAAPPLPAPPSTPGVEPTAPVDTLAPTGVADSQTGETDSLTAADVAAADIPPPPELPESAQRDPSVVGRISPIALGLGLAPWGGASGRFLERAMRFTEGTMPSRWLHIALRNVLLSSAPSPRGVDPADWVAERAWLLLRMGEADAARMLVAGVDVADFTPKLTQVAVQSALASADPAGLCPLRDGLSEVEPRIAPMVNAICASLSGNPSEAAAGIDNARHRGRAGGIDISLADKLVGAGADSKRAVTIEWNPVAKLNTWRFGLAGATGISLPDRLLKTASLPMRAWQARAPMLTIEQRLPAARIATGMGVFSGQSLVDAYSAQYDRTDPDELSQSDAWLLRTAFTGRDQEARMGAMRALWTKSDSDPIDHEATRAMLAVAASTITPNAALASDAPNIIASLLAAGLDQQAARWAPMVAQMDDGPQDRCWAMLALGAPAATGLDLTEKRIDKFIGRDTSEGSRRGALLVAGLVAIGRLDPQAAARLSNRYGFGLDRKTEWTGLIDGAAARGQGGTAAVLAGLGFHSAHWNGVPALFLYHAVSALYGTGQEYSARMIAAEALSRS